ncbi:MAG TPA: hypothetical protein VLF91_06010 [Candidatus Saccharimonadales bacterium]|nr:hypothetical protein [Candidatus Saccharimonadales bacterium]
MNSLELLSDDERFDTDHPEQVDTPAAAPQPHADVLRHQTGAVALAGDRQSYQPDVAVAGSDASSARAVVPRASTIAPQEAQTGSGELSDAELAEVLAADASRGSSGGGGHGHRNRPDVSTPADSDAPPAAGGGGGGRRPPGDTPPPSAGDAPDPGDHDQPGEPDESATPDNPTPSLTAFGDAVEDTVSVRRSGPVELRRLHPNVFKGLPGDVRKLTEILAEATPYQYALDESGVRPEARHYEPISGADNLGMIYDKTAISITAGSDALEVSVRTLATETDATPETTAAHARDVLQATYRVVDAVRRFGHQDRADLLEIGPLLTGPQRIAAVAAFKEINRLGPSEEAYAYMRQFVPQFAWEPHDVPANLPVPAGYEDQLRHNWSDHTPAQAAHLISAADLAAGQAPLHIAFAAARAAEADGHADLGYQLKARLVEEALAIEAARYAAAPATDKPFPFLQTVFAASITGELPVAPPTGAFDYQRAAIEVMAQTWDRLEREAQIGQLGEAARFVGQLAEQYQGYQGGLAPYLARSMVRHAGQSDFDMVGTLRGLSAAGVDWATETIQAAAQLPGRPLLTNNEAREFIEQSPPQAGEAQPTSLVEAVVQFAEDADIYSVDSPLSEVARVASDAQATITVDIDVAAQQATVRIAYRRQGDRRTVPFSVDLQTGEVTLQTIDSEPLDAATQAGYRDLVANAITNEQNQVAAAAAAEAARIEAATRRQQTSRPRNQPAAQPTTPTQGRTSPRIKTHGKADPAMEEAPEAVAEDRQPGAVTVNGLNEDNVVALMGQQNIRDLPASTVVQKITALLNAANETGKAFGKRTSLDAVKGAEGVKLRQINWVAPGGRQIRVYCTYEGNELKLVGVYDKKGTSHQQAYLTGLVKRLKR